MLLFALHSGVSTFQLNMGVALPAADEWLPVKELAFVSGRQLAHAAVEGGRARRCRRSVRGDACGLQQ